MRVKDIGTDYARAEEWENALFCLQTVISRYEAGANSHDDAMAASAAWNNLGYVYLYGRADYSQAFQALLHSQEIAQEIGDAETLPYVDLNLGNIYSLYGDQRNMLKYYRSAFDGAHQLELYDVAVSAISNLLIQSMENNTPKQIEDEIRKFEKMKVPASTPGVRYAQFLAQACRSMASGNLKKTLELLNQANALDIGDMLTPERFMGQATLLRSSILKRQGKLREAVTELRSVAPSSLPDDIRVDFLETESDLLAQMGKPDSAVVTRTMALRINDSLFRTQGYGVIRDLRGDWEARRAAEQLQQADERRARAWLWVWLAAAVSVVIGILAGMVVAKNRHLQQSNQALYQRINEANNQYELMRQQLEARAKAEQKEDADSTEDVDSDLLARVTATLADPSAITSPDFTVDRLAKMIGSNSSYVSRVVNAGTGKNFATLLGEARIRLACSRLKDPGYAQFTIEGIATDLGFRSRTNFIAVFKRATGLTPTEYKKLAQTD